MRSPSFGSVWSRVAAESGGGGGRPRSLPGESASIPPVVRWWVREREPIHSFSSQANRLEIARELFGSDRTRQHDIGPGLRHGGCQGQCIDGSTACDGFRLETREVFA